MKQINNVVKAIVKDRWDVGCLVVSVLAVALLWIIPFQTLGAVSDGALVPLHYNIYFGVDLIAPWTAVLFLPGFATGVLFANVLIAAWLQKEHWLLSRMLHVGHASVSILSLLALFFVLLINA